MDEVSNELMDGGPPDRDDGGALSIEKVSTAESSRESQAQEGAGSLTGTTIGHYLVGERLGGGAMAAVYRAHDQILKRSVAFKVLLPDADAVMQERFRREARTVSTLAHPHIVRTIQVGQSSGVIYIAMELVEGSSLAELLEQSGKLTVSDTARILAPVAEALEYAHAQGIVHRDVKPSNILLRRATPGTPNSVAISVLPYPVVPLLSDFGIARALDAPELTNAGRTIGTPAFMAPEQCAGSSDIDGRADIYALGAVMYRCLVGRPPFSGTTTQILHAHVYDPLLIPELVAQSLPAHVVHIMARAMMKEPAQRYPNVGLMATEMDAAAEQPVPTPAEVSPNLADSTVTMASLPVTQSPESTTSRILVPAAPVTPRAPFKPVARPISTTLPTAPSRVIISAEPPMTRTRTRSNRWGVFALGGALVVLVVLLTAMLVNSLLPGIRGEELGDGSATPTVAAVADVGTPETPEPATTEQAGNVVGEATPSGTVVSANTTPTPTLTATPFPTPAVSLESAWDNAQYFFDVRDWQAAVTWLGIVQRRDKEFAERESVGEMLVTSYIGLATDTSLTGQWPEAIGYLDKALDIDPKNNLLISLRSAIEGLSEAPNEASRIEFRGQLSTLYDGYAEELANNEEVCLAAEQMDAASNIVETEARLVRLNELLQTCKEQEALENQPKLSGSIVYSAEEGGAHRIFRLPIGENMLPIRLVNDAAQPRISPNGSTVAFYSRRSGAEGLYGLQLGGALGPDERSVRYSDTVEDGRDAPPSWSPDSSRLIFSSTRGGNAYRLYVTPADGNISVTDLGFGKDPAWHPTQNLIVYNAPGEGLWQMLPDGTDRRQLTFNGNDQRPAWSPDGRYIVFMSNREGNWELYRLELATSQIVRLTNDGAQDGLPAVSPDGAYVAFMSDRERVWNLWVVSIDGGEAELLSGIAGQPINWLEHSVQWVP
jgi:eukaryotic-like serine/threonine-protein kinase